jgi:tripartite-type tricarboxylate transporter receptor subunit TctC
MRRVHLLFAALLVLLGSPAQSSFAQDFPTRPITLVVPYQPGGPMDIFARLVADAAGEQLGQHIVVENRGGAGGVIGTRSAMRAAADGYTLVFGTSGTLGIAPTLYKNVQFDPGALVPVALVARLPHVLVVHPSVPVKTIQEFIKYGRTNSGKLSFGASLSTPPHLLGALFVRQTDIDALFVPDKGSQTAILDLISGRTQFGFDSMTVNSPLIAEGKVRPLAMIDDRRWPMLPDLPTMIESGYPEFALSAYCGVLAPEHTPPEIVERVNHAINAGLATNSVKARLLEFNIFAQPGSPADFAGYLSRMNAAWRELAERSGAVEQ